MKKAITHFETPETKIKHSSVSPDKIGKYTSEFKLNLRKLKSNHEIEIKKKAINFNNNLESRNINNLIMYRESKLSSPEIHVKRTQIINNRNEKHNNYGGGMLSFKFS
jgi:hypothetical protein